MNRNDGPAASLHLGLRASAFAADVSSSGRKKDKERLKGKENVKLNENREIQKHQHPCNRIKLPKREIRQRKPRPQLTHAIPEDRRNIASTLRNVET